MRPKEIPAFVDLCERLYPMLSIIHNRRMMEKDLEKCKRETALWMIATGQTSGSDFDAFQKEITPDLVDFVDDCKAGRAGAERAAMLESIKVKNKKRAPLTEEEAALAATIPGLTPPPLRYPTSPA